MNEAIPAVQSHYSSKLLILLKVIIVVDPYFHFLGDDATHGIIHYNSRPICSSSWKYANAVVFCKQFGSDADVEMAANQREGTSIKYPYNHNFGVDFANVAFDCDGSETDLSECPNRLLSELCVSDSWVDITCYPNKVILDPRVVSAYDEPEGRLMIGGYPAYAGRWEKKYSDLVCDLVVGSGSTSLRTEFKAFWPWPRIVDVYCLDIDDHFLDCQFEIYFSGSNYYLYNETRYTQPVIACTRCSNEVILQKFSHLSRIQKSTTNSIADVLTAISEAKRWLNTECYVQCDDIYETSSLDSEDLSKYVLFNLNQCKVEAALTLMLRKYSAKFTPRINIVKIPNVLSFKQRFEMERKKEKENKERAGKEETEYAIFNGYAEKLSEFVKSHSESKLKKDRASKQRLQRAINDLRKTLHGNIPKAKAACERTGAETCSKVNFTFMLSRKGCHSIQPQ